MAPDSFLDMQKEILSKVESSVVTGKEKSNVSVHRDKLKKIIAASTIVIEKRGIKWAQDNPEEFVQDTLSSLGFWLKLALFIGGLFMGGSSIWIVLIKFMAPFIIDFFTKQRALGVCGAGPGDVRVSSLADGARTFLSRGGAESGDYHKEPLVCK